MRFLLFNIAVGAAVFYLLIGDPGATARKAGLPEAAVSAIDELSHKAKKTVAEKISETPQSPPQSAAKSAPAPAPEAQPVKAAAKTPPQPPIQQAKYVASKPVHTAPAPKPNPKDEVQGGIQAPVSPALSRRRDEVLGNISDGEKFAVKDGAEMMSPRERYRELSKLVDDMELVYFNSLSN